MELMKIEKKDKKTNKIQNKLIRIKSKEPVTFQNLVFVFIICAILGWFVEVGYVYLLNGKIVNRGMTYGPYCSIYGVGAVILYLLFHNIERTKANIPYIFVIASISMGGFELLSGLGFKYILGIEMWSYDGQFLEILDYTTVPILLGWGILGTFFVFFIQPLLYKIISVIPQRLSKTIATAIITVYFLDLAFSVLNIRLNPEVLQKLVNPNL